MSMNPNDRPGWTVIAIVSRHAVGSQIEGIYVAYDVAKSQVFAQGSYALRRQYHRSQVAQHQRHLRQEVATPLPASRLTAVHLGRDQLQQALDTGVESMQVKS